MFRCWHTDPEERVSFTQLVESMSQTLEKMADYLDVCTFGALDKQIGEAQNNSDNGNKTIVEESIIIHNDDVESHDAGGKDDNGNTIGKDNKSFHDQSDDNQAVTSEL